MSRKETISPEERQDILLKAPKLVQYGISRGWIKPPKKEKEEPAAWYQKKPNALANALS